MSVKAAFDFTGKNVLVVGASRGGIGAAIAAGFAECGAAVEITGAEPEPIERDRGRYPYRQLDVDDPAAFARVLHVNLCGTMHLAVAFKPHLIAMRGAIVNIASMYSTFGSPRV